MSIETFDQRFKRLTSDMLMIDICRLLGIEIRQLMKIRSGNRVELSMNGLRRLCLEQGLDFSSFIRGYSDPWSAELSPTQVITSDEPSEMPAMVKAGSKPLFRADGSRIPQEPTAPVETVRSRNEKPQSPVATPSKLQVSFKPGKAAPAPTVPEKYEPPTHDEYFEDDDDDYDTTTRPSIASRLRDVVTSAVRRNDVQNEPVELYSGVTPARVITNSGSSESTPQPNTPLERKQAQEIEGLILEVSSLRREISDLTNSVRRVLER